MGGQRERVAQREGGRDGTHRERPACHAVSLLLQNACNNYAETRRADARRRQEGVARPTDGTSCCYCGCCECVQLGEPKAYFAAERRRSAHDSFTEIFARLLAADLERQERLDRKAETAGRGGNSVLYGVGCESGRKSWGEKSPVCMRRAFPHSVCVITAAVALGRRNGWHSDHFERVCTCDGKSGPQKKGWKRAPLPQNDRKPMPHMRANEE